MAPFVDALSRTHYLYVIRVDSLDSARSALVMACRYSEWTEKFHAVLLGLLNVAIAEKMFNRLAANEKAAL